MALLTNVTVLLVLACVANQLAPSGCQKSHARKGRGAHKAGRQAKPAAAQPLRGRLVAKDGSACTWAATGEQLLVLRVSCRKGGRSFGCEYEARPAVCAHYGANRQLYWKQIGRALKKHRRLCRDGGGGALVKAAMCRKAARDAHFKPRDAQRNAEAPAATPPPPGDITSCQSHNRKLAAEFCDHSWSSVCTFLFTMVQDYDC